MRRRDVLAATAGLAATPALSFPAPALAQASRRLTMVTDYPDGPGMLPSARRLAQTIAAASGGRIRIEVSAAGAVVRPLETFDAVQAGVAEAVEDVGACAAGDGVGAAVPGDVVVSGAAAEDIVVLAAADGVGSGSAVAGVVPDIAEDQV